MNWATAIAGLVMVVAPFLFGYSGNPAAVWTSLILGVIIAVLGYLKYFKWATLAGVVTLVAPFILGFNGVGAALWTCLVVGAVVTLLAGYQGFFSEEAGAGETQQDNA
jgi:hypothetical protein